MKKIHFHCLWILLFIQVPANASGDGRFWSCDFENGDLAKTAWVKALSHPHSGVLVNAPARVGKYAVKLRLNYTDENNGGGKRAELIRAKDATNETRIRDSIGGTHWYAYSVYFPKTWGVDRAKEYICQFHDTPDKHLGEIGRSPYLAIEIRNDTIFVVNRWDTREYTPGNKYEGIKITPLFPVQRNVWLDWVFRVKWSYLSDGLVQIWMNNKLVFERKGPNCYNDLVGPTFYIGIYKSPWTSGPATDVSFREAYYDEVRTSDHTGSYDLVSPHSLPSQIRIPASPGLQELVVGPNPFHAGGTINYFLPQAGHFDLKIYDLAGKTVRILAAGNAAAGADRVAWDGADGWGRPLANGLYLVRAMFNGKTQAQKLLLQR